MSDLSTGLIGKAEVVVSEQNIAKTMKSGALEVFATPAMVALMEEAACSAVKDYLSDEEGTVGISLNISHVAPTAMNDKVIAVAKLVNIDGRKLVFEVEANDSQKLIGKGIHERFIINNEKFMNKLLKK